MERKHAADDRHLDVLPGLFVRGTAVRCGASLSQGALWHLPGAATGGLSRWARAVVIEHDQGLADWTGVKLSSRQERLPTGCTGVVYSFHVLFIFIFWPWYYYDVVGLG